MVARTQCPALSCSTLQCTVAHSIRLGARQPTVGFGVFNITLGRESASPEISNSLSHQIAQFAVAETVLSGSSHTGRHIAEQFFNQPRQVRFDIVIREVRPYQSHAAVDVIAHAARRYHSPFVGVSGANAADRKPVAPMNIRHDEAGHLNARQRGHVWRPVPEPGSLRMCSSSASLA